MRSDLPEPATEQSVSPSELHPEATERRQGWNHVFILAGLILLAAALRFYKIGEWGLDSDEVFMQRDSINPRPTNARPLMYFLNHHVVYPFLPLKEFGIRLLPAICGVLSIPAFYVVTRKLVGTRAALFGAFLIATSALHIYYSQFGRYWTLVFLLSSVYPYLLYLGVRDGNARMLILGVLTGVLAVLAHPVSILLIGGLGVWLAVTYLRGAALAKLWKQKGVWWGAAVAVVLAIVIAVRFVPILQDWIQQHDRIPTSERGGEFLLRIPGGQGIKQLSMLTAYVESLTIPLVLSGALGIYLLWRENFRRVALLLICLFLFPIAFIMLVSTRTAISAFYLVPAIPVLFIGAGVFLDRLVVLGSGFRPRWIFSAAVAAMIVAAGAPTVISQYRDGRRWDFRGAANWLSQRMGPGDVVYSDQPVVSAYYLPGKNVQRLLPDTARLAKAQAVLHQAGQHGALWIVSPAPSHAFRTNPKLNHLNQWMYHNCQLRNTIGVGRVDFRQNFLQVYRCPPELADRQPESSLNESTR